MNYYSCSLLMDVPDISNNKTININETLSNVNLCISVI